MEVNEKYDDGAFSKRRKLKFTNCDVALMEFLCIQHDMIQEINSITTRK